MHCDVRDVAARAALDVVDIRSRVGRRGPLHIWERKETLDNVFEK
jgi:hypothetical protein